MEAERRGLVVQETSVGESVGVRFQGRQGQTPARVTVSQRQGAWQLVAAGSVGSSILNMFGGKPVGNLVVAGGSPGA